MKRRFADGRSNEHIIEKEYKNYYIHDEEFKGNVSVLKLIKTSKEWHVDEEERCIFASGYTWVEIYPENENYCITIMLDENLKTKEWYFDMSKQNGIEDGVPYEDDLYLDVVIIPNGKVNILDENELESAYKNNEISEEEFKLAYKAKDVVIERYANDIEKLEELTNRILKTIHII